MIDERLNTLRYQLWCIEDPVVLPAHKLRAANVLVQAGKPAIELLVERFNQPGDPITMQQVLVPTGIMNPGPPRIMCVTLKYQIEQILYDIIAPDQAPRPELRGEIATQTSETLKTSMAPPKQTLAQMKSDWDAARDLSIGELAPTELGGAYALVDNWVAFWDEHRHNELEEIQNYYRAQVQRRWARNMSQATAQPGPRADQSRETEPPLPQNLGLLQKAYEQAWVLAEGAKGQPHRKPIAFKGLEDIQRRHPYLGPHVEYLLLQLA